MDGVHVVAGAVWPRRAALYRGGGPGQLAEAATGGRSTGDAARTQAYSLPDLAALYEIPRFDLIHLDVDGAEALLFKGSSSRAWLSRAQIVAVRLHPELAEKYGCPDVRARVAAAGREAGLSVAAVGDDLVVMMTGELAAAARRSGGDPGAGARPQPKAGKPTTKGPKKSGKPRV